MTDQIKIAKKKDESRYTVVGTNPYRIDAWGKVTGRALFAEDHNRPNQLWGAVLRAQYPHARIVEIDISQAKKLSGVKAVLTHHDIPGRVSFGQIKSDQRILADDKVRYLGDGVVLVAATTKEIAREALKKIKITYEPLPIVDDPVKALQDNARPGESIPEFVLFPAS